MPKKKPAKKTKKFKQPRRHKITQEEFLEHLILVSDRAIKGNDGTEFEFFKHQAARLRKELAELRSKNAVRK